MVALATPEKPANDANANAMPTEALAELDFLPFALVTSLTATQL
jgi:hypothetical protein